MFARRSSPETIRAATEEYRQESNPVRQFIGAWCECKDGATIRATRLYVGLFAFITALIALNPPGGIVTLTAFSGSLYAACFLPSIVLGLSWRRGNGRAAAASIVVGFAVLLLWKYLPFAAGIHQVFPAMLGSTLAYAALSLRGASNDAEDVVRLFAAD